MDDINGLVESICLSSQQVKKLEITSLQKTVLSTYGGNKNGSRYCVVDAK